MQFKKKKKKRKNNEFDEALAKEQELLLSNAHDLYIRSQSTEFVVPDLAPIISATKSLSGPARLGEKLIPNSSISLSSLPPTAPQSKEVLRELDKKLSESCANVVESTDFDALGAKP